MRTKALSGKFLCEKDVYYAPDTAAGCAILDTVIFPYSLPNEVVASKLKP